MASEVFWLSTPKFYFMIKSKIEWCEYSHNFWHGCKKLGIECKACYMFRNKKKFEQDGSVVYRLSDATFYKPLYIREKSLIFTCSYSDFFLEEADAWRQDAWDVIRRTPWHTWLILTKRPERIIQCLPPDWGDGWDNVWLGVSVGIQESFHRAYTLSEIPARVRFISAEPLLEELDFLLQRNGKSLLDSFQWVILGGESGDEAGPYKYRLSKLEWYERAISDIKQFKNVRIFVKQLGCHLRKELELKDLFGGNMAEWPEHLRIREYPEY
jgi:protein gp37